MFSGIKIVILYFYLSLWRLLVRNRVVTAVDVMMLGMGSYIVMMITYAISTVSTNSKHVLVFSSYMTMFNTVLFFAYLYVLVMGRSEKTCEEFYKLAGNDQNIYRAVVYLSLFFLLFSSGSLLEIFNVGYLTALLTLLSLLGQILLVMHIFGMTLIGKVKKKVDG